MQLVRRLQGQEENAGGEEVAPTPKKIFQILNQVSTWFVYFLHRGINKDFMLYTADWVLSQL